ncbi:hypothetical protein PVAND_013620 [Polypedilum vanderplanki]|uniref:Transmembrane protein 62 n=1 Tax=Polypedilum vanderplanki TaxID=319348 RepID=A0A9J6CQA1_POLVA|nr:hypothetical protein PVAND_013620 [Polypedilum vanderplanki]
MWFIQITDLHISKFKDPTRIYDLRKFCSEVIPIVNPKFVIASGDLTDAKDAVLGSEQFLEEWQTYYKILTETNVMNKTKWLDLRGNHDNFNVQYLYHKTDLFRNFSSQGPFHKRSYLTQIQVDDSKFDILALDASIEPGTKRPYNFFGMIDEEELSRVENMLQKSDSNYTIWFAHYPTSTILTPAGYMNIRKFIGKHDKSVLFVNGHLHTMGTLINRMYTLHAEGFLELELADFMRTRRFRVAAFDNGLFSALDIQLNTYPLAIITNPKNMLFNNPFKENIDLQAKSTHIRILAFSKSSIVKCKIKINDEEWKTCDKQTENFFTVSWNPSKYSKGKHKISLYIEDENQKSFSAEQYFAFDGTTISFDFLARFILMSELTTIFQVSYIIALIVCTLPLVVFKIWQILLKYKKVQRPKIQSLFWRRFVQKYLILCSINRIYYGLVIMIIWTTVLPWSFHEILDGYTGYVFLWGTFVKGKFVPGTLSYWYGIHQLAWFQLPLMMILAGVVKRSYNRFLVGVKPEENFLQVIKLNLPFLALLFAEGFLAIFYLIQNGFIPFLIAPLRVWSLIYSIILFYHAHFKISESCFQSSARIFAIENEPKQS